MKYFNNDYLSNINLQSGTLDFDSFDINPEKTFDQQQFAFREDLIQIGFGEENCVDVGWYPSINPNGSFRVVVIGNLDWENPIYTKRCKSLAEMKKYLQEAIDIADKMYRETSS